MCNYLSQGPGDLDDPAIPNLFPQNIPASCDVILFYPVYIDINSSILCNTGNLFIKYMFLNIINILVTNLY